MKIGLLFPGQASQYVGMGQDLKALGPEIAQIFALADSATGLPISRVCAEGPESTLTETEYAQPAVVAVSIAAFLVFRQQALSRLPSLPVAYCAGHSVGEFSALVAAGALDPGAALDLVARRAALMGEACRETDGAMAAVFGLDEVVLMGICGEALGATGQVVEIANLNSPDQVVISGHRNAVSYASERALAAGAKRVIPLKVAGAFHSDYMRSAAARFSPFVQAAPMRPPAVPVVLNRTATPSTDVQEIRDELVTQLFSPVHWSESLDYMARHGCDTLIELGPGQVLSGLARRTVRGVRTLNIQDRASLEATLEALQEAA